MRAHSTGQTSETGRSQITMPRVDAEMAGKALQLGRHREHAIGDPELARRLFKAGLGSNVVTTGPAVVVLAFRGVAPCCLEVCRCAPPRQRSLRCAAVG